MAEKKRIEWIDIAKGIGIVLMIATLFVIRSMVRKGDNARAAVNTEN